jgi:hypothetical protein
VISEEEYRKMSASEQIKWLADYNYYGHAIDEELHPIADEVAQLEAEVERLREVFQPLIARALPHEWRGTIEIQCTPDEFRAATNALKSGE